MEPERLNATALVPVFVGTADHVVQLPRLSERSCLARRSPQDGGRPEAHQGHDKHAGLHGGDESLDATVYTAMSPSVTVLLAGPLMVTCADAGTAVAASSTIAARAVSQVALPHKN